MNKALITLAAATMIALAGCQASAPVKQEAAPAAAAKPTLSDDAVKALAQAEADIKAAQSQNALWTTAADALKKAKEAAAATDSAAVIKNAKTASEQAKLGLEQKKYAPSK